MCLGITSLICWVAGSPLTDNGSALWLPYMDIFGSACGWSQWAGIRGDVKEWVSLLPVSEKCVYSLMATSIVCHRCNNWWLRWFWCTLWQLTRAPHEFLQSHGVVMNQAKQTGLIIREDYPYTPLHTSDLSRQIHTWTYVIILKVRSVQPGVSYEKQHPRQQIKRNVKINWESPTTNWCGSKPNAGTAQTFFFIHSLLSVVFLPWPLYRGKLIWILIWITDEMGFSWQSPFLPWNHIDRITT